MKIITDREKEKRMRRILRSERVKLNKIKENNWTNKKKEER